MIAAERRMDKSRHMENDRRKKETKKNINDTKSQRIKNQLQTRYSTLDKDVKRKTKADKRTFIENLADEAETAAQMQNMATLYKITKALAGRFKNCDIPMKDADGVVITSVEEQTQLWKTHFETILNKEAPREVEDIPERYEDLLVNMDPPTANEVKSAIDNMKSGKAPGADGVSAEMLKAGGGVITETFPEIFKEIWEEEEIPVDWKTGLIVKLPKKGNLSHCKNWRGITLLSITSKVFSRVILNRISTALDPMLRKEQAGFRKGRSCGEHIFTLRQILEQCQEWKTPCYVNFIDFEKAFDSIQRESLWCILRHYGIPCKIVTIIKMLYEGFKSKVICGQNLTEEFDIKTGVKQGCILSPFLFCLTIDWIMKRTYIGVKSGIIWTFTESLGDLDFADDISLLAHSHRDIHSKTEKLVRNAAKVGLHVNKDKTKTMRNNCQTADPVKLGEQDIEDVTEFTYLGAKVTKDGNTEAEIKTSINKARGAFAALKNISKMKMISKKTKIRIFKSNVLSVLLYAAESWKVTKGICHMLEVFQNKCLRRILHIFWPNNITNAELHDRTGMLPISLEVKKRRWRWIGHVNRMPPTTIPRIAMRWTPAGSRRRGRPKETWRRSVEREMKALGWSWGQVAKLAADRPRWHSSVSALCASTHEED